MKKIVPQIRVSNCEEALHYYQNIFGGKITNVQKADGTGMFQGMEGKIIHSELHINENCILYLYDGEVKKGESHIDILLDLENEKEIGLIYDALGADGTVMVKLEKQFWGAYHGVVVDKYGTTWGLNFSEVPEE